MIRKTCLSIIFFSFFVITISTAGNTERLTLNFNENWLYFRGEIPDDSAQSALFNDNKWEVVHLPHSPDISPLRHPWRIPGSEGINWYRKHFVLPREYQGRKVFIEFEAADNVTDVWINGVQLLHHSGPYLPFTVDMTNQALFGNQVNVITLKINNFEDRDIPSYGTWISHGGLYRDAHLIVTDKLHITDALSANQVAGGGIFVTYPHISDSLAQIRIKTNIKNEYELKKYCTSRAYLLDSENKIIAEVKISQPVAAGAEFTFEQMITLNDFHLWHPEHPYLYTLTVEVSADQKPVDHIATKIGLRHIQFSAENGLLINGKRFRFTGANRVQEYPYIGWAFSNSAQKRDAVILKEAGFDYLRLSHNPQDPSFLDACDELGILVMACIPGFQYSGGAEFRQNSFQTMRDLIRRDRNHPAIILWELSLNETEYDSSYARTAMKIGHEEFPGDQCFIAGWKFPEIYDVFIRATQHGARDYQGHTPLVISEYGHWDYGGGNSSSDADRSQGEERMLQQAKNHQESLNLNLGMPGLCGDGLWVSIDFQCYPSGILDYFRLPKFSYYFFQSQRDPDLKTANITGGPMVFIANYWTENSPRPVKIFSNCDRVDLFLNGKLIGSRQPDTDSLCTNLHHPPFTYAEVPWQPGRLEAIGSIAGKQVAGHFRITPGTPVKIKIRSSLQMQPRADGEDMFFVYAALVDQNDTIVPVNDLNMQFTVSGSGILVSPAQVKTEAGTASALVRTLKKPGDVTVSAEAQNLGTAVMAWKCAD